MARLKRAKTECDVECGTITTSTAPTLIFQSRRGEVLAAVRPAFGDADEQEQMDAAAEAAFHLGARQLADALDLLAALAEHDGFLAVAFDMNGLVDARAAVR